jgi:uncharacterized membrane protein YqjE
MALVMAFSDLSMMSAKSLRLIDFWQENRLMIISINSFILLLLFPPSTAGFYEIKGLTRFILQGLHESIV